MNATHKLALLGGLSPNAFMRTHWQRTHQLIRQAIPQFSGVLTPAETLKLAQRDDVEARLIIHEGNGRKATWRLEHGPFSARMLKQLPPKNWTILIQGLNGLVPEADALLQQFAFIPYVRLDDVMVSLAAPGGGVGPHFDRYDVFLLQGIGQRRWQVSTQDDLSLRRDMPLKILKNFVPDHDWTLAPGDMLYLPPRYAHDGVAVDTCMTYSIGFRAPTAREMAAALFDQCLERMDEAGAEIFLRDAGLRATTTPGAIPTDHILRLSQLIRNVKWSRDDIAEAAGKLASEPKGSVFFDPPAEHISLAAFRKRAAIQGVRLHAHSTLLYDATHFYINGEVIQRAAALAPLTGLADTRFLSGGAWTVTLEQILYSWFEAGWIL
jgi:50S ribosomal protein L16 3-hydroxylase